MSQRQQLERIMEIDRQIRSGCYPNAHSLAKALEASERTIYDDRRFMQDRLGAPIKHNDDRGGWYYTDPTFTLPGLQVTEGELLAFFLSVEVARRQLGTPFEQPLLSATRKLASSLGDQVRVDLSALQAHYSFATPAAPQVDERLLTHLAQAIRDRQKARLRYFTASRGEWGERTVHPHHLHNFDGNWYLFAFDEQRSEMRSFHLGRMAWCRLLDEKFEPQPDFSPEAYMASAFQQERGEPQTVAIRFDAQQAPYIRERRWHASQGPLQELPDGGLILRFQAGGLGEVRRWVMQYGRHAEVLEPEVLRREVAEELRAAMKWYHGDEARV
jgi:predicted DNA-binding transcriptional regulator YafY